MFEIRDAKRIRREDLRDSSSEGEESAGEESDHATALRARLNAKMASLLSLDVAGDSSAAAAAAPSRPVVSSLPAQHDTMEVETAAEAAGDAAEATVEEAREEEQAGFRFRLFATEGAAPRILLTPEAEARGLTTGPDGHARPLSAVRRRPLSHYLKGEASAEERERFELAARTAADIRAAAAQRNWGLEVPWRVTRVTVSAGAVKTKPGPAKSDTAATTGEDDAETKRRKRPGKKRRIRQRTKDAARVVQEMAMKKQAAEKEEHLKEKKKRLNREKKLKRRQKEKDQKRQASQGGGGPATVSEHAETQSLEDSD